MRQAHPALSSQACELIPRLLIPRSSFPLAYLCQSADPPSTLGATLFTAHIDVLEREAQDRCGTASVLLIAECAQDRRYYAIEHVEQDIYALCALGSCFIARSLELLKGAAQWSDIQDGRKPLELLTDTGGEWWRAAILPPQDPCLDHSKGPSGSVKTHGLTLSLPDIGLQEDVPCLVAREQSPPAAEIQDEGPSQALVAFESFQEPDEIFNLLKTQYQDALYTSRVGLQKSITYTAIIANLTKGIPRILCKRTNFSGSCLVSIWY